MQDTSAHRAKIVRHQAEARNLSNNAISSHGTGGCRTQETIGNKREISGGGVDVAAQRFLAVAALAIGFFVGLLGGAALGGGRLVVGARLAAGGFIVLLDAAPGGGFIFPGAVVLLGATRLRRLLATLLGTVGAGFAQIELHRVGPRCVGHIDRHTSTVEQRGQGGQITINYRLCRSPALSPKSIPLKTKTPVQPHYFVPEPLENARLAKLCGPLDENLRQISAALDVTIFRRGEKFIVSGHNAERAVEILDHFYAIANQIVPIEEVQLALVEQRASMHAGNIAALTPEPAGADDGAPAARAARPRKVETVPAAEIDINSPVLKTRRADLRGRTPHQIRYLRNILEHDISFGVGPAGTGKTYLAVACAVDALERDAVKRIILTRPAVEAGERLGFLPGDLSQKVDPLYDALYDLLGFDRTQKMFEKQVIEIAPLAYMRGRTLNHAFVILDEAQNTTVEQMKMFLTRIGFGSKAVVTGDVTQVDLHKSQKSGLVDAIQVLKEVRGVAFSHFTSEDVVRHPLVARIVDAYETAHNHEAEIAPLLKATALKNVRKK